MTPRTLRAPDPPAGVRIAFADGTEAPAVLHYDGRIDGITRWVACAPRNLRGADVLGIRCDVLPVLTSIAVAFEDGR